MSGEEVQAVMRGDDVVRKSDDDGSKGPAGSTVPSAGRSPRPREEPGAGGMEPQPQG
jgi:cell division protease FtsH